MPFHFAIHRADLARRRERCRAAVDRVSKLPREIVSCCNLCGSGRGAVVATTDRYGWKLRTAMCLDRGLLYVVGRLTRSGYAEFYEQGIYRTLVGEFKGASQTTDR